MKKDNKKDWQEHLEKLEEHYHPDNFFADESNQPSKMLTILSKFATVLH